jgi:hypothetical protein
MKIGILGSGSVGQAIATGLAEHGHEAKIGTRDPSKLKDFLAKAPKGISVGSFSEAAAFGEVIALATNWGGTENALKLAEAKNLDGKVLIDITNPLDFSKGVPGLAVSGANSAGESVQRWVPGAKVVKTLNIVNSNTMIHPQLQEGLPDMFVAGNDAGAKATVAGILKQFGWPEPVDLGHIEHARYLEALAMIWINIAIPTKTWSLAFKLLRK